MAFPYPATNGQTYVNGGYVYTYNATRKTWTKTSVASTQVGNLQASNANLANTTVNTAGITSGNVTIGSNGNISTGNTTLTGNSLSIGNNASNVTLTTNSISTGNTTITTNAVTTGNVTIAANGNITTGNTTITSNAIVTDSVTGNVAGNVTGNVTTGNVTILSDSINVGPLQLTNSNITLNNTTITGTTMTTGNSNITQNTITSNTLYANDIFATGNITANGNVIANTHGVVKGVLYVGNGAAELTGYANPIMLGTNAGNEFVQSLIINTANSGSADWIAQGDNGNDEAGYGDFGFTGSNFSDPAFTITGNNDAYLFSVAVGGPTLGGNLVLATSGNGQNNDIVFGTGGFLSTNEKMRFINALGQLYIKTTTPATDTTSGALRVAGGAGIAGNLFVGGNLSAGNISGNISGNFTAPGANTNILFNDNGIANATAGFTFDKTTNTVTVANTLSTNNLSVTGNVITNLIPNANATYTLGNASYTWKDLYLSGTSIYLGPQTISSNSVGVIISNTLFANNANITTNLIVGNGNVTGTLTVGNITVNQSNITVGNTTVDGNSVAVGNVTVGKSNVAVGNTTVDGNAVTVGNVTVNQSNITTGNVVISETEVNIGGLTLNDTGNITTGNVEITGDAITTGNVTMNDSNVSVGNTTLDGNTVTVGNVTMGTSNVAVGNTTVDGNAVIVGNVTMGTSNVAVGNTTLDGNAVTVGNVTMGVSNVAVGNTTVDGNTVTVGNVTMGTSNVAVGNTTVDGNTVTVGNVTVNISNLAVGNSIIDGNTIQTGNLTANGTGTFAYNSDGQVTIPGSDANGAIQIGNPDRTGSGIPHIDFHSATDNADYDATIKASGGNTIAGKGNLEIIAFNTTFTGNSIIANNANLGNSVVANYFSGDGSNLTNVAATGSVSNGTSNVSIPVINGNVNIVSGGNTTLVVTATGANITGTANISSNLTALNANLGNLAEANYVNVVSNIQTGGILTDNYYYANGSPVDFQQPAGSNTQIQYNNDQNFGASANFTFNSDTNLLTVTGNISASNANLGNLAQANYINIASNANIVGNISAGNANLGNLVEANYVNVANQINGNIANFSGNLTSLNANLGNLITANYANISNNVTVGGNVNSLSIALRNGDTATAYSNTQIAMGYANSNTYQQWIHTRHQSTGSANNAIDFFTNDGTENAVFPANAILGLTINAGKVGIGNVPYPGNVLDIEGNVWANGLITANYFSGDGSNLTNVAATGSVSNGTSNVSIPVINGNVNIVSGGNTTLVVTATGANITGTANISGAVSIGNTANISGNLTSLNANLGNLVEANYVNVANQINGNVANFTGNVTAGNLSTTGSGGNITMTGGNITGANVVNANTFSATSQVTTSNLTVNLELAGNTANFTGNITSLNANLGNLAQANYVNVVNQINGNIANFSGNLTAANANLGNLAEANYVNVATQINGNIANFSGNLTAANSNLGNLATANYINVSSNIISNNLTVNLELSGNTANFTGNITAANANLGNVANANFFSGNGAYLTGINFSNLADATTAGLTINEIYLQGVTNLIVNHTGATGYTFDQYPGLNPSLYITAGTTLAFDLTTAGHPFQIQDGSSVNYDTGLFHVSTTGVVSTGSAAQAKTSGTLYWKVPGDISGNYRYQCQNHLVMTGNIFVQAANIANVLTNYTGNIQAGNANLGNVVVANYFSGNGYYLTGIDTAGIANGNSNVKVYNNANVTISAVGNANVLVVTGDSVVANANVYANANTVQANAIVGNTVTGNLTTAAQPNITSVGTLTSLGVTGNLTSGNANLGNVANANFFSGNGYYLSGIPLDNLSDVLLSSPVQGEFLGYNGVNWVNATISGSVSAGQGVDLWFTSPTVTAASANNSFEIITFDSGPNTTATTYATVTINGVTAPVVATISAPLNRILIDAGNWDFSIWSNVNAVSGTNTIEPAIYTVDPGAGTVTITGTGTSRTATASSGTPFANSVGSANVQACSWLQTPLGLYQISAKTSSTVVTITTPTAYVNESAVAYYVWDQFFVLAPVNINASVPTEYLWSTTQGSKVISTTTRIGGLVLATTSASKQISVSYNGTTTSSHVVTPLATLHNDLAGLQGGQSNEYFHLTTSEYTGTGTGVFVRASNATLTTPNIGAATGTSLAASSNVTAGNVYANSGTIGASLLTGTLTTAAQPNITSLGSLSSLNVTGNASAGNLIGPLANGTSNVNIPSTNGNVNITSAGNTTLVVTGTGANIDGTANVTGNANVGNIGATNGVFASNITAGNANVSGQLISTVATGTAPLVVSSNTVVANLNAATSNIANNVAVTAVSTNISYPTFAYANITGTYPLQMNAAISANLANGALIATTFVGNISGNVTNGALANGNSNVSIPSANGNVNISATGNANVLVITGTGANITGTANISGNANVDNLGAAQVLATANITAPQLISNIATGTAPLVVTSTTRVSNLSVAYANVSDFGVVTTQTTGTFYPTFVSSSSTSNLALGSNANINVSIATGAFNATLLGGTLTTAAQPNVTSLGTLTGLTSGGVINFTTASNVSLGAVGNVKITGGTNGYVLSTDGAGNLSWVAQSGGGGSGASISNGTSNVNIATSGGNVTVGVAGNAAILTITGTGANISGTANITGNLTAANLIGPLANGNSNVNIPSANGNVNISAAGNANVFVVTGTGANVVGNFDVTGSLSAGVGTGGNISGANLVSANFLGGVLISTSSSQPNITSLGQLTGLTVNSASAIVNFATTANVTLGAVANLHISGGTSGYVLSTDGSGTLSWIAVGGGANISNGTSNVNIATSGGNVTVGVAGNANILTVTGTGANISGTANITGIANLGSNLNVTGNANIGNINTAQVLATANITAPQLISNIATGTAPLVVTSTTVVPNLYVSRANLADFGAVTTQTTGTFYPVFVNANTTGNYAHASNANLSFNAATGALSATLFTGTLTTAAQPNVTSLGSLTGLTVSNATGVVNFTTTANVTLGAVANLHISGGTNGYVLSTDGAGNLSWVAQSGGGGGGASISNGTSNVNIATSGGNVTVGVAGNAAILTISGTGINVAGTSNVTGIANVGGNLNVAGNANITGNLTAGNLVAGAGTGGNLSGANVITANTFVGNLVNGNSNIVITANANITFTSNSVATMTITNTGANITGTANITGIANLGSNLNVSGTSNLGPIGNVKITGGSSGQVISTDGSGTLSFINFSSASISNGTSNVNIATSGGNVTVGVAGNAAILTITGTGANISGTANITGIANLGSNLNVTGTSNLGANGNVRITGGSSGYVLSTDGSGNLSWISVGGGANISNGNSNVNIPSANGNVNISAVGNANILVVTGTGANITGTANITGIANVGGNLNVAGNANVTGNLTAGNLVAGAGTGGNLSGANVITANTFVGNLVNGNSNIVITANANITFTSNSVATMAITSTGANISGTANITGIANLGSNLNVSGTSNLGPVGNVKITGGTNGYVLSTDGSGTLSWVAQSGGGGASISNGTSYANITTSAGNITLAVNGTIIANVTSGGITMVPGTSNITGANLVSANYVTGTLTTAAQPNITSTGTLSSLNVSGTVTASQVVSNVATGTAPITVTSTTRVSNLSVAYANVSDYGVVTTQTSGTFYPVFVNGNTTGNYALGSNANMSFNAATATLTVGNIQSGAGSGGTISGANLISANFLGGVLVSTSSAQPNITSVGTLTSLAVTANANVGNLFSAAAVQGTTLTSNIATGTAPITVTSTTVVPNLYVARANVSDYGVVTTQTTGTFYPTFVNANTTANYALASNANMSFNAATGALSATQFVGQLSGNITNATTVLDSAGTGYQVGYRAMPQSTNSSGTFVLADAGKHLYLAGGVTVPPSSSVNFDVGTVITVISNATALTITQGVGVTLRLANSATTGSRSLAANGIASCTKVASDTWYVSGMGVT